MNRCIVKIVGGKPVIFGEAGGDDGDAPVYIFEEEEAFDAALAGGLIPVGALIVKTYDEIEMAGGPFDDALSDESENAVQNKIIAAEVERLDQSIADALALRASLTGFGPGKVCPVGLTDATEANGLLLGAFEKNPAFNGSLAQGIELLKNSAFPYNGDLTDADSANRTGMYRVLGNTQNAPFQWGLLVCFHVAAWIVQIGKGCSVTDSMLYVRTIDNFGNASAVPNWSAWKSVALQ